MEGKRENRHAGGMRATVPNTHHGLTRLPDSRVGMWAVALAGLAVIGTVGSVVAHAVGVEPAESFTDNWVLSLTGLGILVSGAASLVTGGDALIRRHDRSWLVVTAVVVGGLMTALVLQQVGEGLGWLSS